MAIVVACLFAQVGYGSFKVFTFPLVLIQLSEKGVFLEFLARTFASVIDRKRQDSGGRKKTGIYLEVIFPRHIIVRMIFACAVGRSGLFLGGMRVMMIIERALAIFHLNEAGLR